MPNFRLIGATVKPAIRHEQTNKHTEAIFIYIDKSMYINIYSHKMTLTITLLTYKLEIPGWDGNPYVPGIGTGWFLNHTFMWYLERRVLIQAMIIKVK